MIELVIKEAFLFKEKQMAVAISILLLKK